jgi:hypothetical protein
VIKALLAGPGKDRPSATDLRSGPLGLKAKGNCRSRAFVKNVR